MVVGGRFGSEHQVVVTAGACVELVEHDAWLHDCPSAARVDRLHLVDVLGQVQQDSDVAALSGEAGAAPAGQHRRAVLPADLDRGDYVVNGARKDYSNRHLSIVGAVGRVERPAAHIEPDLPGQPARQRSGQAVRVDPYSRAGAAHRRGG
jgi:hypothetical protein